MKEKKIWIILTAINVILLITCIIAASETSKNLKIFNATDDAFDYEEQEEGKVDLTLNKGKRVTIVFHKTNAEVVGAYRYNDKPDLIKIIRFIRYYCKLHEVEIARCNSDLWGEYRIHTALYAVGYKRAQTENANIEYGKDERWYVNAIGSILGWIGI